MQLQRFILTGILTAIPLIVTYVVVAFILQFLAAVGSPAVDFFTSVLNRVSPGISEAFVHPIVQSALAIFVVVAALYVLGLIASLVIGRRLIKFFESFFNRIPLVHTVYGATKKLIETFQGTEGNDNRRVVLIEFPSPEMKTVGFVTRILKDMDSDVDIAAVYVPTTPNPTSGYLELVPIDELVFTDWDFDDAMSFIMSGGAVAPETIHYSKSAAPKDFTQKMAERSRPSM